MQDEIIFAAKQVFIMNFPDSFNLVAVHQQNMAFVSISWKLVLTRMSPNPSYQNFTFFEIIYWMVKIYSISFRFIARV